jgi:DcmR-like sensory protein
VDADRWDMGSGLFSVPTLGEQIESLQRGDHVCVISGGTSLVHSVIVPFVRRCLARKEMCLYAIGERAVEDLAAELTQAGIDLEQAREEGGLVLLRNREFMPFEEFDPSAFIELFGVRGSVIAGEATASSARVSLANSTAGYVRYMQYAAVRHN